MGKYEDIISEAGTIETEIYLTLNGSDIDCNLKARKYLKDLKEDVTILSSNTNNSIFDKIKDAMFYTEGDKKKDHAYNNAINSVYQLKKCLSCMCLNCARNDESCKCEGCLFGSKVIKCEDNIETREPEKNTIQVDGYTVVKTEFDRRTHDTLATVISGETTKKLHLNVETGKTTPIGNR